MSQLNLDVSADTARALHRVVRAMHDGNCPKCGWLGDAAFFWHAAPNQPGEVEPEPGYYECPGCLFYISREVAEAAMSAFQPYATACVKEFETWVETWIDKKNDSPESGELAIIKRPTFCRDDFGKSQLVFDCVQENVCARQALPWAEVLEIMKERDISQIKDFDGLPCIVKKSGPGNGSSADSMFFVRVANI